MTIPQRPRPNACHWPLQCKGLPVHGCLPALEAKSKIHIPMICGFLFVSRHLTKSLFFPFRYAWWKVYLMSWPKRTSRLGR